MKARKKSPSAGVARLAGPTSGRQRQEEQHKGPVVETSLERRLSNEAAGPALRVLSLRSSSCDNISAGSRAKQSRNKACCVPDLYRVGASANAQPSMDAAVANVSTPSSGDSFNVSDSAIGRTQLSDASPQEEEASGAALVGASVKVWWGGDSKWFVGVVDRYDAACRSHYICYTDGDRKWHTLDGTGEEVRYRAAVCMLSPSALLLRSFCV